MNYLGPIYSAVCLASAGPLAVLAQVIILLFSYPSWRTLAYGKSGAYAWFALLLLGLGLLVSAAIGF